jgi:type I restriction enzyme S subunit
MPKKKPEKSLDELLEEALVNEDEQPYEVPGNWVWVKLGTVSKINMGQSPKSTFVDNNPNNIPLIGGPKDMGEIFPNISRYTNKPTKLSDVGDLIISIRATLGKTNFSDRKYCLGRGVASITPHKAEINYLKNYFATIEGYLYEISTGTTFSQISKQDLVDLQFPLPPLPEQKRTVKKLSSMLGKLKEAKELIQEAKETFEERRAAILNKAFTGELTKKWREENRYVESAENLLERIQKRRKATYDAECKKAKKEGKTKPRRIFQDKIPEINYGIKIEIPKSWTYTNIGFLAHVTKLAGFEYTKYINFKDTGEIAIVRAQNVHMCEFIKNNITYIDKKTSDFLVRSQLNEREVLMVFIGAGTGNVCMAPKGRRWHLGPNVAKIDVDEIAAECINYYLQSHVGLANMRLFIKATAQPSLSMATIRKILVNLPPLQEQEEIVRILEKLLDHEDEAEALIDMEEQIDLIEKSILSKAFRGELGTNDPNDEPAIELLKRSLKEKEEAA